MRVKKGIASRSMPSGAGKHLSRAREATGHRFPDRFSGPRQRKLKSRTLSRATRGSAGSYGKWWSSDHGINFPSQRSGCIICSRLFTTQSSASDEASAIKDDALVNLATGREWPNPRLGSSFPPILLISSLIIIFTPMFTECLHPQTTVCFGHYSAAAHSFSSSVLPAQFLGVRETKRFAPRTKATEAPHVRCIPHTTAFFLPSGGDFRDPSAEGSASTT
ncbi:hypothetical protein ZHAS_00001428 [Anopheles sinensis]|uniref:Uncharacterized protein n=1 Tax=Anopheles sinensis TaxID=74873 RepID=A0A084VBB0_ANOSI|nr:hypothetical protein ZHAS_00001428 [Anopheles sinensis]